MAIRLSERVVDAVVTVLQAELETELTAIDTDRADSITMDVPLNADYYKHPQLELSGSVVHIEVWETEVSFIAPPGPYVDQDHNRATFECFVTIRLTLFNREVHSSGDMRIRLRRYSAGLHNVFNQNPALGATDDAIQAAALDRVAWDLDAGDEAQENVRKVQLTAELRVRCEEVYA
jgi:hypothetical protein